MNASRRLHSAQQTAEARFAGSPGAAPGEAALPICGLCPHRCAPAPGKAGLCRARKNEAGRITLPLYGRVTALALDPIEKKPLYHFRPGSQILSAGFAGCNLRCPFCQNWHISQKTDGPWQDISPAELVAAAKKSGGQIAYTYSEPLVHFEYLLEAMALARREGVANVLVSNGCINAEPAAEIIPLLDAANIDLKCFSGETYAEVLGGSLEAVKRFIASAYGAGAHLEVTTLIVPGLNDGLAEFDAASDFLASLASPSSPEAGRRGRAALREIPWHLSAYRPDYRWDAPPTDPSLLAGLARRARQKMPYVYTGNISGGLSDTACPACGETLVSRRGYRVDTGGLAPAREGGFRCASCGERAPFTGETALPRNTIR
ncbi:MAG: AmmeMemoRadiSam system radical SAM enzyme [Treponema sp.]|nr:AmmeMemoRadiSam system radical SAM enzyme [Treponema sp.]